MRKLKKLLLVALLLGLYIAVLFGIKYLIKGNNSLSNNSDIKEKGETKEEPVDKTIKIVNQESNTRPYAIMINNHHDAWPQAGLDDAYIVYEIIAEGGITRMMALFKDQTTATIGSIRSSRHYFLDYALENDAIYVHFGWSPQAQSDIKTIGINNINGLCDNGFWRNNTLGRAYEHTAFTNIEKLDEVVKQKKYRTETAQELLLEYTYEAKPTDLSGKEGAVTANNIEIVYSSYHTTSYNYDTTNKVYKRFMSNEPHVDLATKEQYTAKNIIIEIVENTSIDSYGRQDLKNIGTHNGYYITNGYAIPIKCVKPNRSEQTTYQYMDGTEIVVNDGNTYIQIQPKGQKLTIE